MNATAQRKVYPITDGEALRLLMAWRFIETRFAEAPRLYDIAAVARLSPFHFHRRFKLHFGQTPKEVLTRCQIAHAKKLMLEGVPLSEAGLKSGFAHQSHFTVRFKIATGQTPLQWRLAQLSPAKA